MGVVLLLTVLATELGLLQRILDTTSLTLREWLVCIAVSLSLLVVEEAIKFYLARRGARTVPQTSPQATPQSSPQTV